MSGHTPGPWRINHNPPVVKNSVLIDAPRRDGIADRYAIALLRKDFEHTVDNAQLIVLAPEMLETLGAAFDVLAHHFDTAGRYHSLDRPGGETDENCKICRVAVQVENLIATAKGVV